jgi:hypothetical protein
MHTASKALCQGHRPYRLAIIAGCSGLLTIALVLYFVSVFYSSSLYFQRFSSHVELSQSPGTGDVHDGSFILRPENHVFRRPKTLKMTWNVTRKVQTPDGVQKAVYLINGKSVTVLPTTYNLDSN